MNTLHAFMRSRWTVFVLGAALGIMMSHVQGIAYVAAAQANVARVFQVFGEHVEQEVSLLPPGHQLSSIAVMRFAMQKAMEENHRRGFWSALRAQASLHPFKPPTP